jgi:mono/diheme cytochrome c family protein
MRKRRASRVATVTAVLVLGLVAGARADSAAGDRLAGQWCAECHAVRLDQRSPNPAAPRFVDLAANSGLTDQLLRAVLQSPHKTMPNIMFTPAQMDDIVAYFASLRPPRPN